MDKKTFIKFLLISCAIIIGWNVIMALIGPGTPPPAAPPAAAPQQPEGAAQQGQPAAVPPEPEQQPALAPAPEPEAEEVRDLVLTNGVIETTWTSRGAALQKLRLLAYKAPYFEADGEHRPVLTLLRDFEDGRCGDVIESITLLSPQEGPRGTDQRGTTGNGPEKPHGTWPSNGSWGVSLKPALGASSFSEPDGHTHAATQWQVDDEKGFIAPLVWEKLGRDSGRTRAQVPWGVLAYSTTYYWRVRYQDDLGVWSEWSEVLQFTTSDATSVVYKVVEQTDSRLVFEGALDPKLAVRKTVTIEPDTQHFNVTLEFINRTDSDLRFTYRLRGAAGIESEDYSGGYVGTLVGVRDKDRIKVSQVKPGGLTKGSKFNEFPNIVWTGVVSQYFTALILPERQGWIKSVESKLVTDSDMMWGRGRWEIGRIPPRIDRNRSKVAQNNCTVVIHSTEIAVPQHGTVAYKYRFVSAPILKDALDTYTPGLAQNVLAGTYGWMLWAMSIGTINWLTPVMVGILKFFHWIVPSYGIAIVLLTLLVRVVLHPLNYRSQMSMHKMKLLQPKLTEIQKACGDDKQKMVTEQWGLYKKYGVHPMSGCWPMFLQMPVFIALYTALRVSVELRQAPFIPGWITDLSQPDTVWHFPFWIPTLIGPEFNSLNILPFLMAAIMGINQHLMPMPADPRAAQQQKILKWMPVLFCLIFFSFASGLAVYITVSSAVGILELWWIRKKADKMELKPVDEQRGDASKRGAPPAKPGLMERFMKRLEAQERESEQARSRKDKKGD